MTFEKEVQDRIDAAKAEGHAVYAIGLGGSKYVYRSLNREEFRNLEKELLDDAEKARIKAVTGRQGLEDNDPKLAEIDAQLEREAVEVKQRGEDRVVSVGLLHPALTANTPAGVPTTIAEKIMQASAFGSEEEPELL